MSAEPLYGQIRNSLRSRIVDGSYAPGSRVPSESELGRRFQASRITVRQALAELQKEGLIYTLHGKGSFVSKPKAYQNVSSLMGFAEQMGTMGYEVVNDLLGQESLPADAQVAERLKLDEGQLVSRIRRVRYLNREPVSLEVTWVPHALGQRLARADLARRDIFLILENDCGVNLGHAELAIDAVQADAAAALALNVEAGSPLLRIERLTHDAAGQPIDYEFLYFRGDTFQYRFRVDRQREA
ncbi:MAG: GntR family transcriptional regulator [Aquabacterium sp.]